MNNSASSFDEFMGQIGVRRVTFPQLEPTCQKIQAESTTVHVSGCPLLELPAFSVVPRLAHGKDGSLRSLEILKLVLMRSSDKTSQ